jgi:hypothetical protein
MDYFLVVVIQLSFSNIRLNIIIIILCLRIAEFAAKKMQHYLPVLLSGFVRLARGFLAILKTGFIMLLIGLEELNPVIPLEFVPVTLAMDSAVAFF